MYDKELKHRMAEQEKIEAGKKKSNGARKYAAMCLMTDGLKITEPITKLQMYKE